MKLKRMLIIATICLMSCMTVAHASEIDNNVDTLESEYTETKSKVILVPAETPKLDNPVTADNGSTKIEDELLDFIFPSEINGTIITKIGNNAFYGCELFNSVTIPSTIVEIGENAFANCPNLRYIYFEDRADTEGMILGDNWCGSAITVYKLIKQEIQVTEEIVDFNKIQEDELEDNLGDNYEIDQDTDIIEPDILEEDAESDSNAQESEITDETLDNQQENEDIADIEDDESIENPEITDNNSSNQGNTEETVDPINPENPENPENFDITTDNQGSQIIPEIETPNKDEIIEPILYLFSIDGVNYQCIEGMTWLEWIESLYNINNLEFKDLIDSDGNDITDSDLIVNLGKYFIKASEENLTTEDEIDINESSVDDKQSDISESLENVEQDTQNESESLENIENNDEIRQQETDVTLGENLDKPDDKNLDDIEVQNPDLSEEVETQIIEENIEIPDITE